MAGGSQPDMEPVRSNLGPDTLMFESRFESGNLEKVVRITDTYYELHLRQDFYTNRHCQWFYFQVTRPNSKCRVSWESLGSLSGVFLDSLSSLSAVSQQSL